MDLFVADAQHLYPLELYLKTTCRNGSFRPE
jgi:hypothetical protein